MTTSAPDPNFFSKTPDELVMGDQIVLGRSPYKVVAVKYREVTEDWEITYGDRLPMFLICKSESQLILVK